MLTFQTLWNNHPTIQGIDPPCQSGGIVHFTNQCAIRLGVALTACAINTTRLPNTRHCWHHPKPQGHVLSAEELAKGLKTLPLPGLGKLQIVKPQDFKTVLAGKKGIIFFKDFYQRDGQTFRNRSGDHIDLWNGSRLTDWFSWYRIQFRISWRQVLADYRDSKEIWFWQVI